MSGLSASDFPEPSPLNTVAICGRRADKLSEAKFKLPKLVTVVCDVAKAEERVKLHDWAIKELPQLNVLVNNAGVQRRDRWTTQPPTWSERQSEIATNLEAPVHLVDLFLLHLMKQSSSKIVNVSSGLAFVPSAFAAVYGATKAALHSFTMALRHLLANTSVTVVEIVPPAVNTDLGGVGLHNNGVPLDEFADAIMKRVEAGELEIGYQFSEKGRRASRGESFQHILKIAVEEDIIHSVRVTRVNLLRKRLVGSHAPQCRGSLAKSAPS